MCFVLKKNTVHCMQICMFVGAFVLLLIQECDANVNHSYRLLQSHNHSYV